MSIYTVDIQTGSLTGSFSDRQIDVEVFICDDAETPNARSLAEYEYQRTLKDALANPGPIAKVKLKQDRHELKSESTDAQTVISKQAEAAAQRMIEKMISEGKLKIVE